MRSVGRNDYWQPRVSSSGINERKQNVATSCATTEYNVCNIRAFIRCVELKLKIISIVPTLNFPQITHTSFDRTDEMELNRIDNTKFYDLHRTFGTLYFL